MIDPSIMRQSPTHKSLKLVSRKDKKKLNSSDYQQQKIYDKTEKITPLHVLA